LKFEFLWINLDVDYITFWRVGTLGIPIGFALFVGTANHFVVGQGLVIFDKGAYGDTGSSTASRRTGTVLCFQNERFVGRGGCKFSCIPTILTALINDSCASRQIKVIIATGTKL
jgi:hypothetical protein